MNQGMVIVLPLVFFFLIDLTLFINSLRQGTYSKTARLFSVLFGCVMLSQGLTAVTYACDWKILSLSRTWHYVLNLIALSSMTLASYLWFRYLLMTGKDTEKYLTRKWNVIFSLPVVIVVITGILSNWTHWLFYIDANDVYQSGTLPYLQFTGLVYCLAAIALSFWQISKGMSAVIVLCRLLFYIGPTIAGAAINSTVFRGGYTQIGCSYAVFLLYLEQYITEVNENKRLKSVDSLNKRLQNANDSLMDQMSIVGGLSNAYFSVYSVNLERGRCKAIKVIDAFRRVVKNCHSTELVTKAFLAACVMPEDKKKMREFTDWRTLPERLSENDTTVEEFHGSMSPWEWCRASWIVASRDKDGKAKNVLFTVEDITETVRERIRREQEREQTRKELEESRAAAEAANKAKSDFLFSMSHDIRTPMNAIIGYADLMEKHFGETQKCRDYLGKIKNSSNFLLSLVNNVLEMARIESGKLALDEQICKTTELLNEIISVYSELMKQKQIAFTVDLKVGTEYFYGDRLKISEIFLNILSNAYKYTEEGGRISLVVNDLPCERAGYTLLQTMVSDTGIGMSKDYLPKIFEEFSREYTSTENRIEGTGLGMPIVKKLVDFMDGTIEVESEPGKGTTFTVTIPFRIASEQDERQKVVAEADPKKLVGKRILLVEDNELNTEIATEILSELGVLVDHAENGIICIEMLERVEPEYYDLILMDVQMPELDGYGATEKIRAMKDERKANIPIIAMTANAFEEDRQNAFAAGMNGHLSKPIEVPKLLQVLAEIV